MEFEVSYSLENEQQFWEELDEIVSTHCNTHDVIDNTLRSYLRFTSSYKGEYLHSDYDIARCSWKLFESPTFAAHKDYVRRQIIFSLLQEESGDTLHLIVSFLLLDGRQNEATFEMMNNEGAFPRLLELIQADRDDEALHRMLLVLLYEMSRIQRLRSEDLGLVDDAFVKYMFAIIEQLSLDVNDPYHYPVIRVLLVLNEQYMVSAHQPGPEDSPISEPLTNKVIKFLSIHGSCHKTFGENLILLLNRESETSLQLLILKLLYLLFTTPSTHEYFYTNDLYVLVDVMVRNLLDLPDDSISLRHTYLRVFHPLLSHSQLRHPPHYKRAEVLKLFALLTAGRSAHFAPIDDTTLRLVARCTQIPWLLDSNDVAPAKPTLGMQLRSAVESSLSVVAVAAQREKPGILTPSRSDAKDEDDTEREAPGALSGGGVSLVCEPDADGPAEAPVPQQKRKPALPPPRRVRVRTRAG